MIGLKNWTNSIIVSVIMAVLFELIIPNSNNKKYIKMVINLYVLFVILNPLISKFTNLNGIDINTKNYERYFINENVIETSVGLNSETLINRTVEKNLIDNIKNKLNEIGYNAKSISINIDNENGQINIIKFVEVTSLDNFKNKKSDKKNISINEIEKIDISNKNNIKNDNLRQSEIQNIKKIISEEYDLSEDNIEIN